MSHPRNQLIINDNIDIIMTKVDNLTENKANYSNKTLTGNHYEAPFEY